jgi:hypothetical protein
MICLCSTCKKLGKRIYGLPGIRCTTENPSFIRSRTLRPGSRLLPSVCVCRICIVRNARPAAPEKSKEKKKNTQKTHTQKTKSRR